MLLLAVMGSARPARAGATNAWSDWVFLTAFVGAEVARVDAAPLQLRSDTSFPLRTALPGTAFGFVLGTRLGLWSFGLDYQRTQFIREQLFSNKVYGQAAVNLQLSRFVVLVHLGFGYAGIGGDLRTAQGFGGQLGGAVDFYALRWLSAGVGVALDAGAYTGPPRLTSSVGGTFVVRIGVHY
jgi:hypothetical protein